MSQKHLLHFVNLDLNIHSDDNSLEAANELLEAYKKVILETIHAYFDQIKIDETILIDELEINIGQVENLEELRRKLDYELRNKLDQKFLKNSTNSLENPIEIVEKESFQNLIYPKIEDLLYFLEHGSFRWDYHKTLFKDEKQYSYFYNQTTRYLKNVEPLEFIELAKSNPNVIFRLFYYFPKLKEHALQLIIPEWYSPNDSAYSYIKVKVENHFFELSYKGDSFGASVFLELLLLSYHQKQQPQFLLILMHLMDWIKDATTFTNLLISNKIDFLRSEMNSENMKIITQKIYSLASIQLQEKDIKLFFEILSSKFNIPASALNISQEKYTVSHTNVQKNEYKSFKYCGVIFLYAYLNNLFQNLGLLANKVFVDESAKIKAVYILYYLVTFSEVGDEDDFQFLKMLVGLDTNVFITPHFELIDSEKQMCVHVLEHLIKDWHILKSTSIETIQYNFLQRSGTIKLEERTIDIYLEKSGFDILLDHFPSNYSLIKLKWLDKLLCVLL